MAERIPAGLTRAEGRRFGTTVGGAFLAIAAVTWWRDHTNATLVLSALGGALAMAGLVIPTRLGPVERAWMAFARAISRATTPVVMAVMYLLVLFPVGLARRWLEGNPLVHPLNQGGFWRERPPMARRSPSMRRQF